MSGKNRFDKKTGILLLNMGGPDKLENVRPFLNNIFSDPLILPVPFFLRSLLRIKIVKGRISATEEKYAMLGGGTPLLHLSLKLAQMLKKRLSENNFRCEIALGMRYWHPFIEEGVKELQNRGVDRIIVISMYPHFSQPMTGSLRKELQRVCHNLKCTDKISFIDRWGNEPLYINLMHKKIQSYLEKMSSNAVILFTAHNIPARFIKKGDPYREEVENTVSKIMENFTDRIHFLAYQSDSGPVKWLEPTLKDTLESLPTMGFSEALIVPLSFAIDNLETLYEVDMEYKEIAKSLNIQFKRLPAFNEDKAFIELLVSLIRREMNNE